jgi:hypothetical protein
VLDGILALDQLQSLHLRVEGSETAAAVATLLQQSTALQQLDLGGSSHNTGLKQGLSMMSVNTTLRHLRLNYCSIPNTDVVDIATILSSNTTLTSFSGRYFLESASSSVNAAWARILRTTTSLANVDISVSSDNMESIADSLRHNDKLPLGTTVSLNPFPHSFSLNDPAPFQQAFESNDRLWELSIIGYAVFRSTSARSERMFQTLSPVKTLTELAARLALYGATPEETAAMRDFARPRMPAELWEDTIPSDEGSYTCRCVMCRSVILPRWQDAYIMCHPQLMRVVRCCGYKCAKFMFDRGCERDV